MSFIDVNHDSIFQGCTSPRTLCRARSMRELKNETRKTLSGGGGASNYCHRGRSFPVPVQPPHLSDQGQIPPPLQTSPDPHLDDVRGAFRRKKRLTLPPSPDHGLDGSRRLQQQSTNREEARGTDGSVCGLGRRTQSATSAAVSRLSSTPSRLPSTPSSLPSSPKRLRVPQPRADSRTTPSTT